MMNNSPDTSVMLSPDTGALGGENALFGCSSSLTKAFKGVTVTLAFVRGLETTRRAGGFVLVETLLRSCCERGAEMEVGNFVTPVVDPITPDGMDAKFLLRFCWPQG